MIFAEWLLRPSCICQNWTRHVQSFQGGPRQENNLYSESTETGTKTRKVQDKALTQKLNSDQQQIELQEVLLPSVP